MDEERTETDWAMMYADERKLRMKCQDRLAMFMVDAPPLAGSARDVVYAVLGNEKITEPMLSDMVLTIKNCNDLIAAINLNIFDPVWEITDKERKALDTASCQEEIPESLIERFSKLFIKARKELSEHWHDICHEHDLMCPGQVDEESRLRFEELLKNRSIVERVLN